jgi:GH35 family endo-1,4-beta-xylanase
MILKRLILLLVAALILGVQVVAAQEDTPSLRELGELNGVYIGAAVYTYHLNTPDHVEVLEREFNSLTPENEAKACEVQPELGRFEFDAFDSLVEFAEENEMVIHGHTLLWHQCVPNWLETAEFTREEAIEVLREHIYTVVGRYRGRIAIWDVVNEAWDGPRLRDTPWRRLIGDDYIEIAFQFAHEADPDALLFYNDFGAEEMTPKADAIYEMVADFVERGIPIHGVGMQAHLILGNIDEEEIAENMQRIADLGLEVQITELDIRFQGAPNDNILFQQANDYRSVMETCLNAENCTAFIVWGVSDRYTWLRDPNLGFFENPAVTPLLFDDDYQPKPAYWAVLDALARHAGLDPIISDEELGAMSSDAAMTSEIPPPTFSTASQLAPDSVEGRVYYAPFPVAITLDGERGDWRDVPRVTIESGPMLPTDNDTTMTFAVAADDTHLYFMALVNDSNLVYGVNEAASGWYMEDSVEFYLNTTGDLTIDEYVPGVVQIGIAAANITQPETPLIGGGNSGDAQVSVYAVETNNGYFVEASVPLETDVWSISPENLGVLGFQVHLNGSSGDNRDTKLIWSLADSQDQSWSNPSLFGQLIFWDVNQ